LLSHFAGDM